MSLEIGVKIVNLHTNKLVKILGVCLRFFGDADVVAEEQAPVHARQHIAGLVCTASLNKNTSSLQ